VKLLSDQIQTESRKITDQSQAPNRAEQTVPTLNSLLTYLSLPATSCHSGRAAGALVRSKEVSLLKDLHPRIQSGSANRADSELANQGFSQRNTRHSLQGDELLGWFSMHP